MWWETSLNPSNANVMDVRDRGEALDLKFICMCRILGIWGKIYTKSESFMVLSFKEICFPVEPTHVLGSFPGITVYVCVG